MLNSKVRKLAVSVITIMSACAFTALSASGASAATSTASTHQIAAAPSGCVTGVFGTWDEGTYEQCVVYEQILLNDLWDYGYHGPNQQLTVDGYYGPHTASDVTAFQSYFGIDVDGITGPQTWGTLCSYTYSVGFHGAYWQAAGCGSIV